MSLIYLLFLPFSFGLLCWPLERINICLPRWIALFGMTITLVVTLYLWQQNYSMLLMDISSCATCEFPLWQLEYLYFWIPRFGINFHLALDGLSLLMVVLSSLLGCMAVLCSWNEIKYYQGFFYLNLLWVIGGSIGVFLSIDMFLLFFFWEIMLIPMYFLISLWGYKVSYVVDRVNVTIKFLMYSQLSSLFLLISIISLASMHYDISGLWSFSYKDLLNTQLSNSMEFLLMLGFFFAFSVKMPIVPFHSWLPDIHSQAPTAGSVDLAGILLKTAAYGLFRFVLPLFPTASQSFSVIAMCFGILSIFYGAWMACAQTDIKRLIAYSSISHTGFILLAIYSNNKLSYQGAVIQMIAHSVSIAGMFILCGQLYERLYTRDMRLMGGLWNNIRLIPAFSLCFSAAILGLPGTGNFIGEVIVLFGIFRSYPVIAVLAAFSVIFSTVYTLIIMQRVYYGSILESNSIRIFQKMTFREQFIVIILLFCVFFLGFFPQCILNTSYITMSNIHNWLEKCNYLM